MKTVNTVETIQQPKVSVSNTTTPNFREISKWSLNRKKVRLENKQLSLENKQLNSEIKKLKLQMMFKEEGYPSNLSFDKRMYFDIVLEHQTDTTLTYSVTHQTFDINEEVYVDIEEMFDDLGDDYSISDVESYIENCISDYFSY
ncbi:MAG: hypothetical protein WCG90_07865 [Chitinophagia bacterium]|jgi:hypothetical protein